MDAATMRPRLPKAMATTAATKAMVMKAGLNTPIRYRRTLRTTSERRVRKRSMCGGLGHNAPMGWVFQGSRAKPVRLDQLRPVMLLVVGLHDQVVHGRQPMEIEPAVQMIQLMLHDTCEKILEPFPMGPPLFVLPFQFNPSVPGYHSPNSCLAVNTCTDTSFMIQHEIRRMVNDTGVDEH